MNNTLSTVSKFLMVVIGCLIVYYLMNLAGNSKQLLSDYSGQQAVSVQIKDLNTQIDRLKEEIGKLRTGVELSSRGYATEKDLEKKVAVLATENEKHFADLSEVIDRNREQMREYDYPFTAG